MPDLLERFNPTLVLYPQDPHRDRPGAFRPRNGWGDYHPCSAEFFIAHSVRRDCPERYDLLAGALTRFRRQDSFEVLEPDGLPAARAFVTASRPEQSRRWEWDVCLPSQDPTRAWKTYATFLDGGAEAFRCVAYARQVEAVGHTLLQYWYLYVYNDFLNQHEGDWEMVTLVLGEDGEPVEVAYSNHHGGVRRAWEDAPKAGDSPLVYVSRGSHAGYFDFASGGHALVGELSPGKPPRALFFLVPVRRLANVLIRWAQRIPGIRLFRDNPPADPVRDTDAPAEKVGVRVRPELARLPASLEAGAFDEVDDVWWARFLGYWGSTRPRVSGSVGVIGPWASTSARDQRWRDPLGWVASCKLEVPGEGIVEKVERVAAEVTGRRRRGEGRRARGERRGGRRRRGLS